MWLLLITLVNFAIIGCFIWLWPTQPELLFIIESILIGSLVLLLRQEALSRKLILEKLTAGFSSLKDNDFAVSLPLEKKPQHNALINEFNDVVDILRRERQSLYQRELLLDKMVNASNVVSVLLNHRQQVIYLNHAAKHFFSDNHEAVGLDWQDLAKDLPEQLQEVTNKTSAIVSLSGEEDLEQNWLLSTHHFKLHGANHKLLLLKPITNELQVQETLVWKKVIRVINHELNNSLAPISSMCHSGNILAEQIDNPMLNRVFDTISSRISKLSEFIESYSRLARISLPQRQPYNLIAGLRSLQSLYEFELLTSKEQFEVMADPSQIEQVFINLIKNALEANQDTGAPNHISVSLKQQNNTLLINVIDSGEGMTEQQLLQAFLPSYSTKENGSGIGLAVCKEIIENHDGSIKLINNQNRGLTVEVSLPLPTNSEI